jgi:hypothetical protein
MADRSDTSSWAQVPLLHSCKDFERNPVPKATLTTTFAVVSAAIVAGAGIAAPAVAAAPETEIGTVTDYQRSALRPASAVSGELREQLDTAKVDYLDFAARQGRPADARSVSAFTDPTSTVVLAVGGDTVVDAVSVGTVDGVARGLGVETHESGTASTAAAPVMGFAGDPSVDGYRMAAAGSHIVTVADDPDVKPTQHYTNYVKSWYWKYEQHELLHWERQPRDQRRSVQRRDPADQLLERHGPDLDLVQLRVRRRLERQEPGRGLHRGNRQFQGRRRQDPVVRRLHLDELLHHHRRLPRRHRQVDRQRLVTGPADGALPVHSGPRVHGNRAERHSHPTKCQRMISA